MMKVLPRAPYFRRLFSPGEFKFLVFDAIYCREGKESHLYSLFESVCASEGFNTGLMWLDDRSEFYDKVRTEGRLGALNRMLNAKPGLVYIKFVNLTEEEKDKFYDAPAYVSRDLIFRSQAQRHNALRRYGRYGVYGVMVQREAAKHYKSHYGTAVQGIPVNLRAVVGKSFHLLFLRRGGQTQKS
jgi:hypothetical protein